MTDKEKIEKLLDHLEVFGELYECDSHFANYDNEWCKKHCKWQCPHKECFRHYLLGE